MPRYRDLLAEHTAQAPHVPVALILALIVAGMNVLSALVMLAEAG